MKVLITGAVPPQQSVSPGELLVLHAAELGLRFMVDIATMDCTFDCARAEKDLEWKGKRDLGHSIRHSIHWQEENKT